MISLLALLAIGSMFTNVACFAGGWLLKPHPLKGKLLMIGRRPSGGTGIVMPVKPVRGVINYEEKTGDAPLKADIHLDNGFLWEDRKNGWKFVDVDLDTQHPIRYTGECINDEEAVKVTRKDGTVVNLKYVWRRLTGERLYQIRKDTRLKQLAAIGTGLWDFLTRIMPICLIIIGGVLVVILILLGVGLVHR